MECTLGPGDALYLQPGAFHQVTSCGMSLSLNIDWHTRKSALLGVAAALRGMPRANVYYNAVKSIGLCTGLPSRLLFPLYRPHLDSVD